MKIDKRMYSVSMPKNGASRSSHFSGLYNRIFRDKRAYVHPHSTVQLRSNGVTHDRKRKQTFATFIAFMSVVIRLSITQLITKLQISDQFIKSFLVNKTYNNKDVTLWIK